MIDVKREFYGIPVAILAADGFEEAELLAPLEALTDAGADVKVISLPETGGAIRGKSRADPRIVRVDGTVDRVRPEDFAALVLPGGKASAARLRESAEALSFVRSFFADMKPVAAICHGACLIADSGAAWGKTLTSSPTVRGELEDAGAIWVDKEVVVEHNVVTCRRPEDLTAFTEAMLDRIEAAAKVSEPRY
jgi:protease I